MRKPKMIPFIIAAVLIAGLLVTVSGVRVVPQHMAFVVERQGVYRTTWQSGLHIKIPFVDRISNRVVMLERVGDLPPHPVITSDGAELQIASRVYFYVVDPQLFTYAAEFPLRELEQLTYAALRNVAANTTHDELAVRNDRVNADVVDFINASSDAWGIQAHRVELNTLN